MNIFKIYLNKAFQSHAILLVPLLALVLNLNVSAEEKLIFAVTLIRHGDRTPTDDIKSDPYKWKIEKGELTILGMNQQNKLGSELRKRYVDKFKLLSTKYVNSEIYVRSTDFNRTIQSAESLLSGLYPLGLGPVLTNGTPALPVAYQPIPIRTWPVSLDKLLAFRHVQMESFNDMCKKYVYTTDEWKKENNKYSNKFEIWSKIFGADIQDIKDLFKIGDNLNARQRNGVPFPKGLTDDDANTIMYLSDWMPVHVFKPKQVGNFFGNEFLLKLKDDMQKAIEKRQQFKYILYFGHDSSILTIMSALGAPLELNPPFSSHIDFELYDNDGIYCIQILFNGNPIVLPCEKSGICTFDRFVKIVENSKPL